MDPQKLSKIYDAYYYAHGCGEPYERNPAWLQQFGDIADSIVRDIRPGSVLDAGCAIGLLVEALRQRGVEAYGVDISEYAIQNVPASIKPYCRQGSVAEPFGRRYDLIVSIEVLEHMDQAEAERSVANFCAHSDDVLFSSTPFDYREPTHFNVQPPQYWADLFARRGFYRDVDYDVTFLPPWAARYRRSAEPVHRIVRNYERKFWLLWKENSDLRSLTVQMRDQLSEAHSAAQRLQEMEASRAWRWLEKLRGLKRRFVK